jgi:hypothetical protein
MSQESHNSPPTDAEQLETKSKKRYSMDRPVEQDLQQHLSTPQNTTKTTPTYRLPKPFLVGMVLLVVLTTIGISLREPFLAARVAAANQEVVRQAINSSTRLSKEEKALFEKNFQEALNEPEVDQRLGKLYSLAGGELALKDYVTAVYADDYFHQQKGAERFSCMQDWMVPKLSGDELLREYEKAKLPNVKDVLFRQAIYAFAKTDADRAIKMCQQLSDKHQYPEVESQLVYKLVQSPANIEKALTLARGITDEDARSTALSNVFDLMIKKDIKRAESLFSEIKNSNTQKMAISQLIRVLAEKQPQKAIDIIKTHNPQDSKNLLGYFGTRIGQNKTYDLSNILSMAQNFSKKTNFGTTEYDIFLNGVANGCSYSIYSSMGPAPTNDMTTNGTTGVPAVAMSGTQTPISQEEPRYPLAFQIIAKIQNKSLRERLYVGTIAKMEPASVKKVLPLLLPLKEEPMASHVRKAAAMVLADPNKPRTEEDAILALSLAKEIQSPNDRAVALQLVAIFWRKTDPTKALEIAQTIPDEEIKARTVERLQRYLK